MKLIEDEDKFDELQSIFIGGIIDAIKENIDEAKLPDNKSRELLENISFTVATILDGSRSVEYENVEANPIITFKNNDKEIVYPGDSSWMHEYVFGTISEIYDE